ncbi:MAG: hypothetical protein ACOVO3_03780, partial [Fluviicola sp.]
MNEVIDTNLPDNVSNSKRSVLLSVLCILTWIGCVWYFLMAIYGMITLESTATAIRTLYSFVEKPPLVSEYLPDYVYDMMAKIDQYMMFLRIHQAASVMNAVFCFWGAILIWRRKRTGYFMYLFAQIPYFVTGILVYWAGSEFPFIGTLSGIITMFSLVMVVIFTILY